MKMNIILIMTLNFQKNIMINYIKRRLKTYIDSWGLRKLMKTGKTCAQKYKSSEYKGSV